MAVRWPPTVGSKWEHRWSGVEITVTGVKSDVVWFKYADGQTTNVSKTVFMTAYKRVGR